MTVKEYQKKKLEEKGYVAIEGDPLADAIWLWWINIGSQKGFLPGTVASSCELADYLREQGLAPALPIKEERDGSQ